MFLKFSGVLGSVLVLFGVIGGLVTGAWSSLLISGHLLLGMVVFGLWFFARGLSEIGAARAAVTGRGARLGANLAINVFAVVGILVLVNWMVHRHNKRWDLTEAGVYSLAPASAGVVRDLKAPLKIVAFRGSPQMNEEAVKSLLELYTYHSKQVSWDFVDPNNKPHLVEKYGMNPGNLIYIEYGAEKKEVSRINDTSEEAITNAIVKLTRGAAKKVYFIEGHREPELIAQDERGIKTFADALSDEHLTVEGLLLAQTGKIPADAKAVILMAPEQALAAAEVDVLVKYVEDGGRLLMFTDPQAVGSVAEIASKFGIEVRSDVVVDQVQRLFSGPALSAQFMVRDYDMGHQITRSFGQQQVTVFTLASSVAKSDKPVAGAVYSDLVKTGPQAWGETDLEALFSEAAPTAEIGGNDKTGPLNVGIAYEKKLTPAGDQPSSEEAKFDKLGRVVVFGDSDWVRNAGINFYGNRDLALNALNWLVGEEGGLTIRPRSMRASALEPLSETVVNSIVIASFIVPELILLFGLFVWWRRRTVSV